MKKNEIVFLINSLSLGGAERIAASLSSFLTDKNYSVLIYCLDDAPVEYELHESVVIKTLPMSGISKSIFFLAAIFVQAIYLRIFHKNSVSISFLHRANLLNIFYCLLSRKKALISERSLFTRSYSGFKFHLMKLLLRSAYKYAHVIAISEAVRNELCGALNVSPLSISVIYNPICIGVDKNFYPPFLRVGKPFRFLVVGRLIKSKNPLDALHTFSRLAAVFPGSTLTYAGVGNCQDSIKQAASSLDLSESVLFLGKVANICDVYREHDVLLFPSSFESFGNVGLEAAACSLFVIYNRSLTSMDEVFSHTSSLSVSVDFTDYDETVKVISQAISSFEPRSYSRELRELRLRFSRETIFDNYMHLIKKVKQGDL